MTRVVRSARRRPVAFLLTLAALVGVTAAALAFLLVSGSGTANGSVSATATATISGGSASETLVPSTSATADVVAVVQNTSGSPLRVGSLVLDTSRGTSGYSANAAGCAVTYAAQSNGGAGWALAVGQTRTIDLLDSVTMGTSAPTGCQGQTFTVYLKAA